MQNTNQRKVAGTDPEEPIYGPRMKIMVNGKEVIAKLESHNSSPNTPYAEMRFTLNVEGKLVQVARSDVIEPWIA